MRRYLALTLVVVVSLAGVACSNDDSSSTTSGSEEGSSKPTSDKTDSKTFSVETPEGQASISLDGELPPNWPEDFPAPKQSDVAGSGSLAGDDSGVMVGVYTSRQSGSEVFEDYESNPDLGASDVTTVSPGDAFLGRMEISGSFDGSITVTALDDTTYVVVVLHGGGGSGSESSSSTSTTSSVPPTSTTTG